MSCWTRWPRPDRVVERIGKGLMGRLADARQDPRPRVAAGAHPDLGLLIVDTDTTLAPAHSDTKQTTKAKDASSSCVQGGRLASRGMYPSVATSRDRTT